MKVNRRTQADRTAATRAALVAAARSLFAERGFAAVGTEEIVRAAGVTRGALYHQFADKSELFAAVLEAVEQTVMERVVAMITAAGAEDPLEELRVGANAWLDVCGEPEVQRIVLIDGPAVLGWERWRAVGMRHAMGLVEGVLGAAIAAGHVPGQPVAPLAHVVVGALDEAALYVARAERPAQARDEVRGVVDRLIAGLSLAH
jgi:AcrR family transcriptional regulator